VAAYTTSLAVSLTDKIKPAATDLQKTELSFAAHFDLVSIYPFYDGNGRTSRLLMNYIQAVFGLPLAIVFKEDKSDYFTALQESRKQENIQPFYTFMYLQYEKYLTLEIKTFKQSLQTDKEIKKSGGGFSIFF
jgi:Fic family protein